MGKEALAELNDEHGKSKGKLEKGDDQILRVEPKFNTNSTILLIEIESK